MCYNYYVVELKDVIMTFDEYNESGIELSADLSDDVGLLMYLYYDFHSELNDYPEENICESCKELKEMTENVIKKYDFPNSTILNAFNNGFEDWTEFAQDVKKLLNKILENVANP